jgi:hypothetical protein
MTTTQQIERGRVFSADEVRAFLNGKVQFREVVDVGKIKPSIWTHESIGEIRSAETGMWKAYVKEFRGVGSKPFACPYPVGSRIWVKETWLYVGDGSGCCDLCTSEALANPKNHKTKNVWYRATQEEKVKWRNSTQMPRWASRLLLEVVSVKVERTDKWEWVYEVKRVEVD